MIQKIKWGFMAAILLYGMIMIVTGSVNPEI